MTHLVAHAVGLSTKFGIGNRAVRALAKWSLSLHHYRVLTNGNTGSQSGSPNSNKDLC